MRIYRNVPKQLLYIVLREVDDNGVSIQEVSKLDPWVERMMVTANSTEKVEPARRAFAHLLTRENYDLSEFFVGGAWWDSDEEIRTFLEYTYRYAWPDAAWPIPAAEYDDVELVKAPGPTWSLHANRWGPDAPPTPLERRRAK
jgi:hypothetical protein